MPLHDPKPTYKPFAYPWAYEAWQLQQRLNSWHDKQRMIEPYCRF